MAAGSQHFDASRPLVLLQKLRRCPYHWFDSRFDKHSALNVREPWDMTMVGDIASTALNLLDRYVRASEKQELQPCRFKLAALASLTLALKYHDDDPLNMVRKRIIQPHAPSHNGPPAQVHLVKDLAYDIEMALD